MMVLSKMCYFLFNILFFLPILAAGGAMLNCQQKLYFREIDRDFLAVQDKAIHTYKFAVALSGCVFRRKFGTKALNSLKRLYISTLGPILYLMN